MLRRLLFILLIFLLNVCYGEVDLRCSKDSDCPLNASCQNGRSCFCKDGYLDDIKDTLRCIKEATKYNDSCEQDIQCNGFLGLRSHCEFDDPNNAVGRCICNSDSHFKEGICHKNSFIGDKCKVSSDCIILDRDLQAYCEKERCICPPKTVHSYNRRNCLRYAGLDEKCDPDEFQPTICIVDYSQCNEYCTCRMGYVASQDKKKCLKAADNLDETCEEDAQCSEFIKLSSCNMTTRKCDCKKISHRLSDACWLTVDLGRLCEHDSECFVTGNRSGVACQDGLCRCKRGFTSLDKSCVRIDTASFRFSSAAHSVIIDVIVLSLPILVIFLNIISNQRILLGTRLY